MFYPANKITLEIVSNHPKLYVVFVWIVKNISKKAPSYLVKNILIKCYAGSPIFFYFWENVFLAFLQTRDIAYFRDWNSVKWLAAAAQNCEEMSNI